MGDGHAERYAAACRYAEQKMLELAIDRLPEFDGAWPIELAEKWFDMFFTLLRQAEAAQRRQPQR